MKIDLTASEFKALVSPVLHAVSNDPTLPVICGLLIESRGEWLTATGTDRFRAVVKRIRKRPTDDDPSTEWPEFKALIEKRSANSILAMFKTRRYSDPEMTFVVEDDVLTVEAAGGFDLFDQAKFSHRLVNGEYPNVTKLIQKALDTPDNERDSMGGFNPKFLSDFKVSTAASLRIQMGRPREPMLVTDDDGLIGVLMPRKLVGDRESWDGMFTESPATKGDKKAVA